MALRKLPLPLFSAKSLVSQPGYSTRYLHFVATVGEKTDHYALVCESQPLMTSRSHGLPARCPICGAQIYFKENANANQQGQRR
jgi:hypothetical protein